MVGTLFWRQRAKWISLRERWKQKDIGVWLYIQRDKCMKWHARGAPGHFAANQLADTTSHLADTFGQLADSRIWSTRRRTGYLADILGQPSFRVRIVSNRSYGFHTCRTNNTFSFIWLEENLKTGTENWFWADIAW